MRSKTFLNPVSGAVIRVEQLPPLRLLECLDWLAVLEQRLAMRERPLEALYLEDRLFKGVCDRILRLHGLLAEELPHALVVQLATVDLPNLNRMEPGENGEKGEGEAVTVQEWVYSLIAALMESEGMRGAIAVAETVPCDLLDGVLKARAKQLQTDKEPSLDSPEYRELIEELDKDLMMMPT